MRSRDVRKVAPFLLLFACLNTRCSVDRGTGEDDRPPIGSPCSSDAECKYGRRCIARTCQVDHGDCRTDNDCLNDTYCACPPELESEKCACVPWGGPPRPDSFDKSCRGSAFDPEQFENPIIKCQWPPSGMAPTYRDVITSPVVIDLDGDGNQEIVFSAGLIGTGHLVAMSGRDCTVVWDKPVAVGCMHIAAADLDGDGKVEIVGYSAPSFLTLLTVWDYQGNVLATNGEPGGACSRDYPPAIANLDGTGAPEIVAGAAAFRFERNPTPTLTKLWNHNLVEEGAWATIGIAEDLDGDGKMEVITGRKVWDGITGTDKTKPSMKDLGGGYPAIGDFNADGKPDIVLVSSRMGDQKVTIIDYTNDRFIMPTTAAINGWGGAPTVADFDGDGKPEFATSSSNYYYVYAPECLMSPRPARCTGSDAGVLWQSASQDDSSGSTGSSVFDFNGDGIAEVIYRDECWLRVYSGPDGKKLFAAPVSSGTDIELPVIADTDGDGHAEIITTSDGAGATKCRNGKYPTELGIPHPGPSYGVRVYVDPKNRWMGSRKMWNQHSYHITNINEDRTVPTVEMPNYKMFNNYRQNMQGVIMGSPSRPDGTGKIELPVDVGDCITLFRLSGVLCNRGAADLPTGFPGTFYLGDPRSGGRALCTARTTKVAHSGECQGVSCEWNNPSPGPYDLWLRAGDDGKKWPTEEQCKNGNDLAHLSLTSCMSGPG